MQKQFDVTLTGLLCTFTGQYGIIGCQWRC